MPKPIIEIIAGGPDLDPEIHGAKASGLQMLLRAGLAVPPGFVVPIEGTGRVAEPKMAAALASAVDGLVQGVADPVLAVRSGSRVSLPGAFSTILGVSPGEVADAVTAVVASAVSDRAQMIAATLGLDGVPRTAVVVQLQVDSNLDERSGAGAATSRSVITGRPPPTGSFAWRVTGDGVMAGTVPVLPLAAVGLRLPDAHERLISDLVMLDDDASGPIEIEFVIESGVLWYLQIRSVGVINVPDPVALAPGSEIVGFGRPASPGTASGDLVTNVADALDAIDSQRPVVLALETTSPSDVEAMIGSAAMFTALGGPECHAAVITRSARVPAVVSVRGLEIRPGHIMIGDRRINVGEKVTVDGTTGTIASTTVTP